MNNYEYLVLNKLDNYALLLNKNFSPNKNGGDIILIKNDANSQLVEVEKDKEKAFTCYANGAIHDSRECIESMWKMMHFHDIDRPLDYIDEIALRGARNGSKHLLAEVVIAKQEGRLQKYAEEIEKHYEPIFDSPDFKLDENWNTAAEDYDDDDDFEEDDGRYDAWA